MYLPEKPKAPVTAIRTPAFRQTEKITNSARYRNAPNGWLFPANRLRLWTGKDGNERARLSAPRFSLADSHEAAAIPIQPWGRNARKRAKSRQRVPELVEWYMQGKIQIDPLVSRTMPLDQINTAFEYMERAEGVRSIVQF